MNAIVEAAEPKAASLQIPEETASLIKASIAENTLKAYQRALWNLETWLSGRTLSDALLANYITGLHEAGKSPATIGQAVAGREMATEASITGNRELPCHSRQR